MLAAGKRRVECVHTFVQTGKCMATYTTQAAHVFWSGTSAAARQGCVDAVVAGSACSCNRTALAELRAQGLHFRRLA
jgi:hypothetical protein